MATENFNENLSCKDRGFFDHLLLKIEKTQCVHEMLVNRLTSIEEFPAMVVVSDLLKEIEHDIDAHVGNL